MFCYYVPMKLIVGLGNPWKEYENTRHNIGFMIVDHFLEQKNSGHVWRIYVHKRKWEVAEIHINNQKIMFLKPMEFMNCSWWAVSIIAHFYKIPSTNILVIHDDIDLPVAKIQLKFWGSSAGHNGIKDIIEKLWTHQFRRLRIWVGRPLSQQDVADYVLSNFTKEEKCLIDDKTHEIQNYIMEFLLK